MRVISPRPGPRLTLGALVAVAITLSAPSLVAADTATDAPKKDPRYPFRTDFALHLSCSHEQYT